MTIGYYVEVLTASGIRQALIDDFQSLSYRREVNAPGIAQIALQGNHSKLDTLTENAQIQIYRKNDTLGLDWDVDFVGFLRAEERTTDRGEDRYTGYAIGALSLLSRRVNAHYANTANRSTFNNLPVETVMKTMVHTNAGAAATTASGRLRNGVIPGISIASNQSRGTSITWNNAYVNLLDDLQELSAAYSIDFDLTKTGAYNWSFEVYPGQLGTDRTSTVIFSLENGNMRNPEYSYDSIDESTVVIVGGEGPENARQIITISGVRYAANRDYEIFADARSNKGSIAALTATGTAALNKAIPKQGFSFEVVQTPGSAYGVHYFLGDLVTAKYKGLSVTMKVQAVEITYSRAELEQINITLKVVA